MADDRLCERAILGKYDGRRILRTPRASRHGPPRSSTARSASSTSGSSRSEWLHERPKTEIATPPIFRAFDCLWLAGRDLRERALSRRRDQLQQVLDGQDVLLPARRLADHGLKAWAPVLERGDEGLVAKDPESPYRGGRTLAWLKVKVPRYRENERGWEPRPSNRG